MTDHRRSNDQGRPIDDRPPVRFQSRLPGGDRSPFIPIAALVLLVGIAALTAGQAVPGPTGHGPAGSAIAADVAGSHSPSPSTPTNSRADPDVAAICLEPASWRTATIETWRDQTVRVWRAIDPVPASGPDDPAIPIVPAVGSRVAAIGFCAPVVGPERPMGPASIDAWRRQTIAGDGAGSAPGVVSSAAPVVAAPVRLDLRAIVPTGSPSPFGALFVPSAATDGATGWTPGIVVFRYTPLTGAPAPAATWFAIEVSLTDAAGKPALPSEAPRGPLRASADPLP